MMRPMQLTELAPVVNGTMSGADVQFVRVSTDTRSTREGDLFLALRGENFDGHDFIAEAVAKGAVAVVVEGGAGKTDTTVPVSARNAGVPVLEVADTLRALGLIATYNRSLFSGAVIAVTGSNGKTTVKELLRRILLQQAPVLATQGNLNNAIGAPLTLLQLTGEHRAAIIELGASGPGEIAWTASLAAPQVCILTNAGEAHMAGFGSYDGLVAAKGEIITETAADGIVILNHDDPACDTWRGLAAQRTVITVSAEGNSDADVAAKAVTESAAGLKFDVQLAGEETLPVSLRLSGVHNVSNALLAIAAARAVGVGLDVVAAGLAAADPVKGRMQVLSLGQSVTVIDDSYNANPTAMRAALRSLAGRQGRRVAVLGDMAELGGDVAAQHTELGQLAARLGIQHLYVTGRYADAYARGFGANTRVAPTHARLLEMIRDELLAQVAAPSSRRADEEPERTTILVKGSRSARMDQIVALLFEKAQS